MIRTIPHIITDDERILLTEAVTKAVSGMRQQRQFRQSVTNVHSSVHERLSEIVSRCTDIPKSITIDGVDWVYVHVSKWITYTIYDVGGCFPSHTDTPMHGKDPRIRTLFTLLIYLTDDTAGETIFRGNASLRGDIVVQPVACTGVLFDIHAPHEARPCAEQKTIIACKVMYVRDNDSQS